MLPLPDPMEEPSVYLRRGILSGKVNRESFFFTHMLSITAKHDTPLLMFILGGGGKKRVYLTRLASVKKTPLLLCFTPYLADANPHRCY